MLAETKIMLLMSVCSVVLPSAMTGMVYQYKQDVMASESTSVDYSRRPDGHGLVYYDLWDSMNTCRDQVHSRVPGNKRNIVVDNRSSLYDDRKHQYIIYINVDVVGKKNWFSKSSSYEGRVICKTDVATNKVKFFRLKPIGES